MITRRFRRYLAERDEPAERDGSATPRTSRRTARGASSPTRPACWSSTAAPARSTRPCGRWPSSASTDVAVCGLAKRLEEVWLPGEDSPVILPRTQRGPVPAAAGPGRGAPVRDHLSPGKKRPRRMTISELDDVPGLGPARRAALLRHFGSVRKLRGPASADDRRGARVRPAAGRDGRGRPAHGEHRRRRRPASAGANGDCNSRRGGGPDARPGLVRNAITTAGAPEIVDHHRHVRGRAVRRRPSRWRTWTGSWPTTCRPPCSPTMLDLARAGQGAVPRVAAVVDVRSRAFSTDLKSRARRARFDRGAARTWCSSRRTTRRWCAGSRTSAGRIRCRRTAGWSTASRAEREQLHGIRAEADLVIDTSALNVHELRARMRDVFGDERDTGDAGHRGLVRLQVRPAGRRRHGGGLPVPAQSALGARAGPADRAGPRGPRLRARPAGRGRLPARLPRGAAAIALAGYERERQALRHARGRLHRRQAPQRGDRRRRSRPGWPAAGRASRSAHRDLGRE